jgi:MtN3 and saliva related transmembrane protein
MELSSAIGFVAATLTTVSFVPQVVRILRTRDTNGISLAMYLVFTAGILLWLTYGVMTGDLPVILANVVTFALAVTILVLKIRNG